ncbi:MAG TPA: DUF512 domain-containing protein, partial [Allocoleopsis sp.]
NIRSKLLKNHRAGQILDQLKWFQNKRLQIHAQVVVCPEINDGIHLERTLLDLASFHQGEIPAVISTAVVPVGLTHFRDNLDELIPVSKDKAIEVIKQVQTLQQQFKEKLGTTFAWLADEWFLIAQQELPHPEHYEDYPQIGNGVGSIRQFIQDFTAKADQMLPSSIAHPVNLKWVVGNAVEKAFIPLVKQLNQVENLTVELCAFKSDYWGQEITVTGLLTGQDLLKGLQNKDLGDGILLPALMLKHDDTCFLDDLSVEDIETQLNTQIFIVTNIESLLNTCLGQPLIKKSKTMENQFPN